MEAEEAQRLLFMALNGQAALHAIWAPPNLVRKAARLAEGGGGRRNQEDEEEKAKHEARKGARSVDSRKTGRPVKFEAAQGTEEGISITEEEIGFGCSANARTTAVGVVGDQEVLPEDWRGGVVRAVNMYRSVLQIAEENEASQVGRIGRGFVSFGLQPST